MSEKEKEKRRESVLESWSCIIRLQMRLIQILVLTLIINDITGFININVNAGKGRLINDQISTDTKSPSHRILKSIPSADINNDFENPSTFETAKRQLSRLFNSNVGSLNMSKTERFLRIFFGWTLLIIAKSAALASPLYFRALVNQGKIIDNSIKGVITLDAVIQNSAIGLIIGYGSAKVSSGFIQLICELILSSATVSAAGYNE